jgi:hypothetical protein
MKGSMQAAAAIGIGYVLGRHRKFRTAAMVAAGMTFGGGTVGSLIMKRGMKMLGSTEAIQKVAPQLGDLADIVRGDLVAAGKAAATAAVSSQLDALTDSIHDRAERLRNPAATVAEGAEEATEAGRTAARTGRRAATGAAKGAGDAAGGTTRRLTGRGKAAEPEADEADVDDDYEADDYEADDDDTRGDDHRDDDYEDGGRAEEADEAPARPTSARRRAPVSRARR